MNYLARSVEGTVLVNKEHVTSLNMSLKSCMNKLCIQYGSTLQGRVVAARDLLNITKNTPIMVNDSIILFPTKSIRHIDCMYINYFEVEALMKRDKGCVITFKDCQKLELGVSYEKMKNRLALCERFSFILKNEKKVFTL